MKYVLVYEPAPNIASTAPLYFAAHGARAREFHERGTLLRIGAFARAQDYGAMAVFATRESAEEFAAGDPFVENGVVASWEVRDWDEISFEHPADPDAASVARHVDVTVARPVADVYDYVRNPENLPAWAAGLGAAVHRVDGKWIAESPMGGVVVAFAPRNDYGVLDHDVTLPNGETVRNPMRVIAAPGGSLVVFTLSRRPGVTEAEFAADAATVSADLARLRGILEGGPE
ncbi:YciI family protein [Glaciibacter sp. 2TAF33]|uniref:YciI family protein n=1 Tax=Glaciibacter sp. 2TAF33 TaxID=3233015 RepID=UPI003F90CFD7